MLQVNIQDKKADRIMRNESESASKIDRCQASKMWSKTLVDYINSQVADISTFSLEYISELYILRKGNFDDVICMSFFKVLLKGNSLS